MYKKVDNSQWMYITSIYHERFSPFIAVSVSGQNIYESSWNSVPDQTAPSVTPTPIHPCRWCLTLFQTTNFRLFQNETVCRQQFQLR